MATIFTHAILAGSLSQVAPKLEKKEKIRLIILLLTVSVIPDLDVLAFALHIPYEHPLGHRGFSHSIVFAFLMAMLASVIVIPKSEWFQLKWWWILFLIFLAGVSHGILDAMTTGGKGVGFFIPFDSSRYFFDWRPIKVSPFGTQFFTDRAWLILKTEIIIIWIPVLLATIAVRIARRLNKSSKAT